MKIYRDLATLSPDTQSGAVAIGNFDGVHRGHARIAKELVTAAQETGGPAVVFTFEPHPVRLLRPAEAPPPLTWTERISNGSATAAVDARGFLSADRL